MSRRRETTVPCQHPGCTERTLYWLPTRDERRALKKSGRQWSGETWLCKRHVSPEQLLTPAQPLQTRVLHVFEQPTGHYFHKTEDGSDTGCGISNGPGFRAIADDLPVGSRIVITAKLVLP